MRQINVFPEKGNKQCPGVRMYEYGLGIEERQFGAFELESP